MLDQRTRAREARANISGWSDNSKNILADLPKTEFTGYSDYRTEAKVIAILVNDESVDSVNEGDCTVVLDKTPFYGEGGGQVGDTGTIYSGNVLLNVYDTKKTDGVYIHLCTVANGTLDVGDTVVADITDARRDAIKRNHSAAHLLQAALRSVLGTHVEQAGSYVDENVCRFDFTHFVALTENELKQVEALVNAHILAANEIVTREMDIESARKEGAMALFGEKYGKTVRVVKMGSFSTELCGGTHCDNTGKIGLFKITSESSVAAGVRRIEAVTGLGVLHVLATREALINQAAAELKVPNANDLAKRANAVMGEIAALKKEIEALNNKIASSKLDGVLSSAKQIKSVKLIAFNAEGMDVDSARTLGDKIKAEHSDTVAVLAVNANGKLNFIAVAGKDAVAKGVHAGKLVGAVAAVTGGKGGGRPDSAMAGGQDATKIDEALKKAEEIVETMSK